MQNPPDKLVIANKHMVSHERHPGGEKLWSLIIPLVSVANTDVSRY